MKKYVMMQERILDYIIITFGAFMYSAAIVVFIKPAKIPVSGLTGVALILNYLFGLPAGMLYAVFNVPLILLGLKTFGKTFLIRTAYTVAVSSVLLDIMPSLIPVFKGDILISLLFGGVIGGTGLGLVLLRGSTSGGIDIISKLIGRKTGMPLGTLYMIMDGVIFLFAAAAYKNIESALYGVILSYVSSSVVNSILIGRDMSNGAFIITDKPKEISDAIISYLKRGVTAINATGMYTQQNKTVLLCAVRRHEVIALKRIIAETDPKSFMLLSNVQEVLGSGFKPIVLDPGKKR